jgi:hypothetical protein
VSPGLLERPRALGLFWGLSAFAAGFALAGLAVLLGAGGQPVYVICVFVGFVGIGAAGFFIHRGTVPLPDGAIWSPAGLSTVARGVGLPARAVLVGFYVLVAFGVLVNLLLPLFGVL